MNIKDFMKSQQIKTFNERASRINREEKLKNEKNRHRRPKVKNQIVTELDIDFSMMK